VLRLEIVDFTPSHTRPFPPGSWRCISSQIRHFKKRHHCSSPKTVLSAQNFVEIEAVVVEFLKCPFSVVMCAAKKKPKLQS